MKKSLLNIICCPICKGNFSLKVFSEISGEVKEGQLLCNCGQSFLITSFIPRIILDKLSIKKRETAESFAFEWQKFSQMRDEWKKNFDFYFEPAGNFPSKNQIALEVGCGNGRHTFYAGKKFKELVSVDLGGAVDVAYENNKNQQNVHFVQADVYNLPFKENYFDFIFSIGVLHHLPDPEAGFKKFIFHVKQEGGVLIYLYHSFSKTTFKFYLLAAVNYFRKITVKLPHKILYLLCYPIACLSYIILVLPYKFLFKNFIKSGWPLGAYADYSFFVLLNDTFDRFSAPIENRYSKEEVLRWFTKYNFKNIKIMGGTGWRAFGIK